MLTVTIVPPIQIQIQNNDDDHSIDTVTDCLGITRQQNKNNCKIDGFN